MSASQRLDVPRQFQSEIGYTVVIVGTETTGLEET